MAMRGCAGGKAENWQISDGKECRWMLNESWKREADICGVNIEG